MTDKIEVVRVKSCDLSRGQIIRLNCTYKTELGDFIAIGDMRKDRLYINESVPEEDVARFLQICGYEGDYINDESCPIAEIIDFVYGKYGFLVLSVLEDMYSTKKEQREKAKAKAAAAQYLKQIDKFRSTEDSDICFYDTEYVVYELSRLANETGRKTIHNCVGIGTECVFYLGYLMGKGIINLKEVHKNGTAI